MLPNQKWLFTLDNVGGSHPPPPAASLAHMYLTIARSQHVGIAHKKRFLSRLPSSSYSPIG